MRRFASNFVLYTHRLQPGTRIGNLGVLWYSGGPVKRNELRDASTLPTWEEARARR